MDTDAEIRTTRSWHVWRVAATGRGAFASRPYLVRSTAKKAAATWAEPNPAPSVRVRPPLRSRAGLPETPACRWERRPSMTDDQFDALMGELARIDQRVDAKFAALEHRLTGIEQHLLQRIDELDELLQTDPRPPVDDLDPT